MFFYLKLITACFTVFNIVLYLSKFSSRRVILNHSYEELNQLSGTLQIPVEANI
ncbi:MAG: hypothetical protein U9Q66_03900 [Patescibacteria group bacterium]|nr:hypothetical protein [Patescibacteria group bacterium]